MQLGGEGWLLGGSTVCRCQQQRCSALPTQRSVTSTTSLTGADQVRSLGSGAHGKVDTEYNICTLDHRVDICVSHRARISAVPGPVPMLAWSWLQL